MTENRRPGAYGIVRRDGALLLVWDQEDEEWYLPGGGIEGNETPAEALTREMTEETGFRLISASPLVYGEQMNRQGVIREQHFFLAAVDDTDPGPAEHEHVWLPFVEAIDHVEPATRTALALATPSIVTTAVDDLHDPLVPDPTVDHRQAVADAGCFAVVEVGGEPSSGTDRPLRILAANLERGNHLDAWVDLFTRAEADVILISEADGGMARSGNRYVVRELAERLGMQFAFAVEFVELGLGGPKEKAALPPDAHNEFGVHGGAVLSRVGLDRPAAVRFEFDGSWFADDSPEPRIGGRCAVVATVGDVVVVAPHLESHGGPKGRARQVADLLDLVEPYADGRPVVVGGDLNTHTLDLRGEDAHDGQDAAADGSIDEFPDERFVRPFAHEPLFAAAAERGYDWEAANTDEPTHRTEYRGGPVRGRLNLDWFLTRGLRASDPEVIPALDAAGQAISDHDVLAVTVARTWRT